MVSNEDLRMRSLGGGRLVLNMPIRPGDEIAENVLALAGRFREVADNQLVKDVVVGDGERPGHSGVCHNPDQETRRRRHRERVIVALESTGSPKEVFVLRFDSATRWKLRRSHGAMGVSAVDRETLRSLLAEIEARSAVRVATCQVCQLAD